MNLYSVKKFKSWLKSLFFYDAILLSIFHIVKRFTNRSAKLFYSHTGEDIILSYLLDKSRKGFYIDVGCNHPKINNNTYLFYLNGWRGLNIDAENEYINLFKKYRPFDISVCVAISDIESELLFYKSSHKEVSTLNSDIYKQFSKIWSYEKPIVVNSLRLDTILKKYLPENSVIDFLSIDVEGHEFQVLKSIDLIKYKPKVILLESHLFKLENYANDVIV